MTNSMSDTHLYDVVRAADPLAGEPVRPSSETEAALARLLALDAGTPADTLSPRGNRRWWMERLTPPTVGAAVAVAAIVAVSLNSGSRFNLRQLGAARARTVLTRAADVLSDAHGAILEADVSSAQTWPDGKTAIVTQQAWQELKKPYDQRTITTGPGAKPIEMATVHGAQWLYDPSRNTIYTADPTPPFTLSAGPRPGTSTLHVGQQTRTVSATQAAKLKSGADEWADGGGPSQRLIVIPRATTGSQVLSSVRELAIALIRAPGSTVAGGVTVDGHEAIQITSADGKTVYDIAPGTYTPIRISQPVPDVPGDPPSRTTSTFTEWKKLKGTPANLALLSLTAQHPRATVDSTAAGYTAAERRLFQ
jgi:outer membrane lipoprotein-sorting protein